MELATRRATGTAVERFRSFYESSAHEPLPATDRLYADDVIFEDPIHRLQGIDELETYLKRFHEIVTPRRFIFSDELSDERSAMLTWRMEVENQGPGRLLTVAGVSHIRFDDKITHHRNYYDTRALSPSRLPLLERAIRALRLGR